MIPEKFHYYLAALAKAHTRAQRRRLIEGADPKIIKLICEISHNILQKNVNISPSQFDHLKSYRHCMRKLINRKLPIENKKKILINQKGGFLSLLIPIISSLAGGLLGTIFNKK